MLSSDELGSYLLRCLNITLCLSLQYLLSLSFYSARGRRNSEHPTSSPHWNMSLMPAILGEVWLSPISA